MLYDKKIKYLEYLENGDKIRSVGFVKIEALEKECNIQLTINGLFPTDTFVREVWIGDGIKETVLGELEFKQGCGQVRWKKMSVNSLGKEHISYGNLKDIRIKLSKNRELRCKWGDGAANGQEKTLSRSFDNNKVQNGTRFSEKEISAAQKPEQQFEQITVDCKQAMEVPIMHSPRLPALGTVEKQEPKLFIRWMNPAEEVSTFDSFSEENNQHEQLVEEIEKEELKRGDREGKEIDRIEAERGKGREIDRGEAERGEGREIGRREAERGEGREIDRRGAEKREVERDREESSFQTRMKAANSMEEVWKEGMIQKAYEERTNADVITSYSVTNNGMQQKEIAYVSSENPIVYKQNQEKKFNDKESKIWNEERESNSGQAVIDSISNKRKVREGSEQFPSEKVSIQAERKKVENGNPTGEPLLEHNKELVLPKTPEVSVTQKNPVIPEKLYDDKWKQLSYLYPHIAPFHDERDYLSISPGDFVILHRKYHKLVNNSFLLHGYYNYEHLILARVVKRGEDYFYVGVPGNFYEREKQVAIMFGFESFECKKEPAQIGDFGYYMIRVEM